MEIIWAPWRLSYVKSVGKEEKGCFICKAAREYPERADENLVLYKGERALVILNKFPYNTGHLMVCPVRHTGDFASLLPEEISEIHDLIKRALRALKRAYNPDGFNIGLNLGRASGGSVETHIHYHVVPRWVGDTNFLPVVAGVKVIPQFLRETLETLRKNWE